PPIPRWMAHVIIHLTDRRPDRCVFWSPSKTRPETWPSPTNMREMSATKTVAINPIGMMQLPGSFLPTLRFQALLMSRNLATNVDDERRELDLLFSYGARTSG